MGGTGGACVELVFGYEDPPPPPRLCSPKSPIPPKLAMPVGIPKPYDRLLCAFSAASLAPALDAAAARASRVAL